MRYSINTKKYQAPRVYFQPHRKTHWVAGQRPLPGTKVSRWWHSLSWRLKLLVVLDGLVVVYILALGIELNIFYMP